MLKKIDISRPITQYFLGLILNILFLITLYSFSSSFINVQIPSGKYLNNIWNTSDVISYVDPAKNFIKHGVFGENMTPDHFRTIGYPALISFFCFAFGKYWLLTLQVFQSIIFAFIYPFVSSTIKILLPQSNDKLIKTIFLSLCFFGVYFTRGAMILTDTLFVLLFVISFYFGLKTYMSKNKKYIITYLFICTITSLIRPTLTLLPLLNIAVGYFVSKQYNLNIKKTFLKSLLISISLFLLINISTLRNHINYSFDSPSSVIGLNAFEYLSKKVLIMEGKTSDYNSYKNELNSITDISKKDKKYKAIMYKTIVYYPISTIKVLSFNTINLFLSENLISNTSNYFNYNWKTTKNSFYPYKTSKIIYFFTYFFMVLYALLWLLFFLKIIDLLRNSDFKLLFIISILILMFIVPAILTGDGGARFRLPFEHILFIFGLTKLFEIKNSQITRNKNII